MKSTMPWLVIWKLASRSAESAGDKLMVSAQRSAGARSTSERHLEAEMLTRGHGLHHLEHALLALAFPGVQPDLGGMGQHVSAQGFFGVCLRQGRQARVRC